VFLVLSFWPHTWPHNQKEWDRFDINFWQLHSAPEAKIRGENGGDNGDSGDIIINKVNNDITDIDLIGYSGVSTTVSTNTTKRRHPSPCIDAATFPHPQSGGKLRRCPAFRLPAKEILPVILGAAPLIMMDLHLFFGQRTGEGREGGALRLRLPMGAVRSPDIARRSLKKV
jgi:hypothetical protein